MIFGRGRVQVNSPKALSMSWNAVSASAATKLQSAAESPASVWFFSSWSRALPPDGSGASMEVAITSIGTESDMACPTGVRMLVRPGPEITNATPGFPEARA